MNVFSGPPARTSDPLAAFDPSTIGDPVGPGYGQPGVGHGDVQTGGFALPGDCRRNPIGFAPPEEPAFGARFRTEISFKRHREVPRASATQDEPDDAPPPVWPTPEPARASDHVVAAADDPDPGAGEPATDEERLPFYKREISFRRKRTAPAEETVQAVSGGEAESGTTSPQVDSPSSGSAELRDPVTAEAAPDQVSTPEADAEPTAEAAGSAPQDDLPREQPDGAPTGGAPEGSAGDPPVPTPSDPRDAIPVASAASAEEALSAAPQPPLPVGEEEPSENAASAAAPEPSVKSRIRREDHGKPKRGRRARGGKGHRSVGLKIGASQIAAAVVVETDGAHELVQLARRPLEAGIVVDGEVRDREALTRALKAFFQEENLPQHDIRLGIGSNRIGVRIFEIAGVDDEARFDNAVRFKAHEVLPVAVNESVLDYRVLEERPNEAGELSRRVLLVVAPRDQVEPFAEVADRAGLRLAGIDLEAFGLLRAFVAPERFAARKADDTAQVVVAVGHESSTLLVSSAGVCEFTRVFDWGGGALQDAIAQELEVPAAEAATILRHLSLSGPGRQLEGLDDAARTRAVTVVRNRLTPFARELVNSLQFYQTQPESLGIGGIIITGGASQLEGIAAALNQIIGVNVTLGDPLARVVVREELDAATEAAVGSLAIPIGLAIEDLPMRTVNLSSSGAAKTRSRKSTLVAIGVPVAVAVPLIALGALYVGAHGTVSSRQSELAAVQAKIAALPKPTGPVIDPALASTDAQRAIGVANVLGGRIAWEQMFRDVSRVLPDNVWLSAMTATAPDPASPVAAVGAPGTPVGAAPTDVSITGATYTQTDVARLLARLSTLPSLSNVALVSSTTQKAEGQKQTVQFNIVASMNTSGGGAS